MFAGFQGKAVFQGFQPLLVFFVSQEILPVLREGFSRREGGSCRGSAAQAQDVRTAWGTWNLEKVCIIVGL